MKTIILIILITITTMIFAVESEEPVWTRVEHGAHYSKMRMAKQSFSENDEVDVYKFNPESFNIGVFKASHPVNSDYWHWQKDMICIINAAMVDDDNVTSLGVLRGKDFSIENIPNPDMNMMMFIGNGQSENKIEFRFAEENDISKIDHEYLCMLQGIGLIRNGKQLNCYSDMVASFSAVGKDKEGNLIFILCRPPYQLSEIPGLMKKFNLELNDLMLVEKGPNAFVSFNNRERIVYHGGSYEFGKYMGLDNKRQARVPYVIGLKRGIK